MNYDQAATLLGVDPGTPVDAARKEYVARARILHPDRYSGAPAADIKAASNAMAQLNQAWEIYQQGPRSTASSNGRFQPEPEPGFPTYNGTDVCEMCGWGPALPVKLNSVQGIIIWWRWGTMEARFCHLCGIAAYNEAQRSTLTRGWWGIIAPVATIIAFIGNMSRIGRIKKLPKPQGRSPYAVTLLPIPMVFTTPWYRRPLVWVSTIIAFSIAGWVLLGAIADSSRSTRTPTTPVTVPTAPAAPANQAGAGSCWDEQGSTGKLRRVDCADSAAEWRAITSRTNAQDCPTADYIDLGTGVFLCLARL